MSFSLPENMIILITMIHFIRYISTSLFLEEKKREEKKRERKAEGKAIHMVKNVWASGATKSAVFQLLFL